MKSFPRSREANPQVGNHAAFRSVIRAISPRFSQGRRRLEGSRMMAEFMGKRKEIWQVVDGLSDFSFFVPGPAAKRRRLADGPELATASSPTRSLDEHHDARSSPRRGGCRPRGRGPPSPTSSYSAPATCHGGAPAQSASSIVAEVVTGSHVLKIEGYSRTKGVGNSKYIESGTFVVGGHTWCIRYYPNGDGSYNADWISIFLSLIDRDDPRDVKTELKFSLLDHLGKPVPLFTKSSEMIRTFWTERRTYGFNRFIQRKALEESSYLREDCFRVRCDITITKEIRTEANPRFVVVPPSDLHRHLGRILSAGDGADVTFEVGGEEFAAHRIVLAARSSVFMAELFGAMKEKIMTRIRINDMEASVFKALLHFIYTDSLSDVVDTTAMVQHLLVAADRYNLERLKLICEDKLCNDIDTSTAATTLALAEQHCCQGLKEACFKFLKSPGNMKAVMASDGFEHLRNVCPSLLEELVSILAP